MPWATRIVVPDRQNVADEHHAQTEQDAGNCPRHEHSADRNAGQGADNDHRHARRNNGADGGRGGRNRGRKRYRVAFLFHARNHDRANGGGFGDSSSGNTGKHHRGGNVSQAQAAANPADTGAGETDDSVGNAATVHQVPGHDEAGNAQQDEGIDAGVDFLRENNQRDVGVKEQVSGRRNTEADGDRNADDQTDDKSGE